MKKHILFILFCLIMMLPGKYSPAQTYDPCQSITNITCGVPVQAVIPPGTGAYDLYPTGTSYVFGAYGKELCYSFTPSVSGKYTLSVLNADYNSVAYLYKNASLGCDRYSWNSITSFYGPGGPALIGNLIAGTTYYLFLDAYNDYYGANHEFVIDCHTPFDACSNITSVNCDEDVTFNITQGPGTFDTPTCIFGSNNPDYGREAIFTYTPANSGKITVVVTATTGWDWVTYYIKNANDGCNSNNWTCLGGASSAWEPIFLNSYEVTGGTEYYIMADLSTLNGASQTFHVLCPQVSDPCNNNYPELFCETPVSVNIPSGLGAYDTVGQYCASFYTQVENPGMEVIFSITATVTGIYRFEITNTNYKQITYSYKEATNCDPLGWKCIGTAAYPSTLYTSEPLVAGTTYYIMTDANTASGGTADLIIHCDPLTDPCSQILPLECGSSVSYLLETGKGLINTPNNQWSVVADGKEVIYEFTPAITGTYQLNYSSVSGGTVFLFYKEASSGCNDQDWNFLGIPPYYIPGSIPVPGQLVAGTAYYIMADSYNNLYPPGAGGTFSIECPSVMYDPCPSVTTIPGCDVEMITQHSQGLGSMSPYPPPGYWDPPAIGKENLFSFTPIVSGKYKIIGDSLSGTGNITYSIKEASGGCNDKDWKLIGSFYNNGWQNYETIIPQELISGTEYYILADAGDTLEKSQSFHLICPVPYDPCPNITPLTCGEYQSFTYPDGNGAYAFNCEGQFPAGSELVLSFTPVETGKYFFNGYSMPNASLYMKEASLGCDGFNWQCIQYGYSNSIYFTTPSDLIAGTEYLFLVQAIVDWDGYGGVSLRIDCQADCIIYADADGDGYGDPQLPFHYCGGPYPGYSANNNDCNDQNSGVNPASDEICGNGIDDNCNGAIDEDCGCGLTVNAGSDESTYFGYSSDQTITRSAVVIGGTPPYTYSWTLSRPLKCNQVNSSGDEIFTYGTCVNNICPSSGSLINTPSCTGSQNIKVKLIDTADVCVTVTDANGCIATDCFKIMAADARCFTGNSNNTKVMVCHYTNNSNHPWVEICVDENAVPNLLAQGDYIGSCINVRESKPGLSVFNIFPNPVSYLTTIEIVSSGSDKASIDIFNITGQNVLSESLKLAQGMNRHQLDLSHLYPGIYQVRMINNGEVIVRSLVISR